MARMVAAFDQAALAAPLEPTTATRLVPAAAPPQEPGCFVRLGHWDHLAAGHFIRCISLFPETLDDDVLQRSLAQVLHRAPMLAGRLQTTAAGSLCIACNNAGAHFTSVQLAETNLESLVPDPPTANGSFVPCPALEQLQPHCPSFTTGGHQLPSRDQPLLAVKHTHLASGGSALATFLCQACCDPAAVVMLLEHWAEAYTNLVEVGVFANSSTVTPGRDPPDSSSDCQPPFPFASSVLESIAQQRLRELKAAGKQPQPPLPLQPCIATTPGGNDVTQGAAAVGQMAWHVSAERLAQLKQQANDQLPQAHLGNNGADASHTAHCSNAAAEDSVAADGPSHPVRWVSSRDALTARLHQVLASLPGRDGKPLPLWLCVDLRHRLPGVPAECLGNVGCPVLVEARGGGYGLPEASGARTSGEGAARVRAAVGRAADEAADALAAALQHEREQTSTCSCRAPLAGAPAESASGSSCSACLVVAPWNMDQGRLCFGTGNAPAWFHPGPCAGTSGECAVAVMLPAVPAAVAAGSAAPWGAPDADGLYVYLFAGQQELDELRRRHPAL